MGSDCRTAFRRDGVKQQLRLSWPGEADKAVGSICSIVYVIHKFRYTHKNSGTGNRT